MRDKHFALRGAGRMRLLVVAEGRRSSSGGRRSCGGGGSWVSLLRDFHTTSQMQLAMHMKLKGGGELRAADRARVHHGSVVIAIDVLLQPDTRLVRLVACVSLAVKAPVNCSDHLQGLVLLSGRRSDQHVESRANRQLLELGQGSMRASPPP